MSKLVFLYGAMNSSKSANLIMDWHNFTSNGKSVLVFKPSLDTRDDKYVTSRAVPTKVPANIISKDNVGVMYKAVEIFNPRVVLVDEINFFTPQQVEELASIVDNLGVTVKVYGLMSTFKGELFESSKRLVELADVVERIRSECTTCSREGLINSRYLDGFIQSDGETFVVGAEETYKVLCRKCFNQEKINKIFTSTE